MWVIKEGINFVHGFDANHFALIMTTSPSEAKHFRSKRDAELWIDQYGNDLESFESLRILQDDSGNVRQSWSSWSRKKRDASPFEGG